MSQIQHKSRVFQARPVEFELIPCKYLDIEHVYVEAKYNVSVGGNWVGAITNAMNNIGDIPDNFDHTNTSNYVEGFASMFHDNHPGSINYVDNGDENRSDLQIMDFFTEALYDKLWSFTGGPSGTRSLDIERIQEDLLLSFPVVQATDASSNNYYNNNKMGDVINQSNVADILTMIKETRFGFYRDSSNNQQFNVPVGGGNRFLDINDKIVFPINITSIMGYGDIIDDSDTFLYTENNIKYKYQLNIIITQNVSTSDENAPGCPECVGCTSGLLDDSGNPIKTTIIPGEVIT